MDGGAEGLIARCVAMPERAGFSQGHRPSDLSGVSVLRRRLSAIHEGEYAMEPAEHQTASVAEQIGHRNPVAKRDQRRGLLCGAADPEAVDGPTVGGGWRVARRPGWC